MSSLTTAEILSAIDNVLLAKDENCKILISVRELDVLKTQIDILEQEKAQTKLELQSLTKELKKTNARADFYLAQGLSKEPKVRSLCSFL